MRYSTLKGLVEQFKSANSIVGYPVYPGPDDPQIPEAYVLLTRYDGTGLTVDDLFDGVGWQVKVVGEQHAYDEAEDFIVNLDGFLRRVYSSRHGGVWVTGIARVGGGPSALLVDDADRTHFVCSYSIETESA